MSACLPTRHYVFSAGARALDPQHITFQNSINCSVMHDLSIIQIFRAHVRNFSRSVDKQASRQTNTGQAIASALTCSGGNNSDANN